MQQTLPQDEGVFLKVVSAFVFNGEIARPGELVEATKTEARDLLERGKAIVATAEDTAPTLAAEAAAQAEAEAQAAEQAAAEAKAKADAAEAAAQAKEAAAEKAKAAK